MANPEQYLERHRRKWRVVVKVPAKLRPIIGTTKLKAPLNVTTLEEANRLKWDEVARLKGRLLQAEKDLVSGDPLRPEALQLRAKHSEHDAASTERITARAEQIEDIHGPAKAADFAELARGLSTPLDEHSEAFIAYKSYSLATQQDFKRAVEWLSAWRRKAHGAPFLEYIDRKTAGRFIDEFLMVGRSRDKVAVYLAVLREYWRWMKQRGHVDENPWLDQDLPLPPRRSRDEEPDGGKRAYTDEEISKLLYGPAGPRIADIMLIAALSGMRIEEICQLRVQDCDDGSFNIRAGKTDAARRTVPIHTGLKKLIQRRSKGKQPDRYLIEELPEVPASRDSRSDPAVKEFTRYRRKQGVDERPNDKAKSNVDFHSFRRWFIRKARDAMHKGKAGFDEWTFPAVIGHTESDRPKSLDLAMRGYAGSDPDEAKRALVEAVKVPKRPT